MQLDYTCIVWFGKWFVPYGQETILNLPAGKKQRSYVRAIDTEKWGRHGSPSSYLNHSEKVKQKGTKLLNTIEVPINECCHFSYGTTEVAKKRWVTSIMENRNNHDKDVVGLLMKKARKKNETWHLMTVK